jgi:uncharacterized protein (DUF983 family)
MIESNPAGQQTVRPQSLSSMLWRAVRLRCPVCGLGRLFRGWFRMYPTCEHCGFRFERGPGYWLGSIYVNYGLTAVLVTAGYFAAFFSDAMPMDVVVWLLVGFCVLFPLWFFRFARGIWLAFDLYFDPAQKHESPEKPPIENDPHGGSA